MCSVNAKAALALHIDLGQPVTEPLEPVTKLALAEPPTRQPGAECIGGRRSESTEVGGDGDRAASSGSGTPAQRSLADSGRVKVTVPALWSEGEVSLPGERFEQRTPPGGKHLPDVGEPAISGYYRDELLPGEDLAVESLAHHHAQ